MIDQVHGKAGQLAYAWNRRFTKVSGISRPAFYQHHAQTPDQVTFALCAHLVRIDHLAAVVCTVHVHHANFASDSIDLHIGDNRCKTSFLVDATGHATAMKPSLAHLR